MSGRPAQRDFRGLKVWEKAHALTLDCYRSTRAFPSEERFGLVSQIRRSSSSVPANIAEGCGRGGNDLPRFFDIAFGSASERQYHLILAHGLEFLPLEDYQRLSDQAEEVKRMFSSYVGKVRSES